MSTDADGSLSLMSQTHADVDISLQHNLPASSDIKVKVIWQTLVTFFSSYSHLAGTLTSAITLLI